MTVYLVRLTYASVPFKSSAPPKGALRPLMLFILQFSSIKRRTAVKKTSFGALGNLYSLFRLLHPFIGSCVVVGGDVRDEQEGESDVSSADDSTNPLRRVHSSPLCCLRLSPPIACRTDTDTVNIDVDILVIPKC